MKTCKHCGKLHKRRGAFCSYKGAGNCHDAYHNLRKKATKESVYTEKTQCETVYTDNSDLLVALAELRKTNEAIKQELIVTNERLNSLEAANLRLESILLSGEYEAAQVTKKNEDTGNDSPMAGWEHYLGERDVTPEAPPPAMVPISESLIANVKKTMRKGVSLDD